jgi:hypothetical protein
MSDDNGKKVYETGVPGQEGSGRMAPTLPETQDEGLGAPTIIPSFTEGEESEDVRLSDVDRAAFEAAKREQQKETSESYESFEKRSQELKNKMRTAGTKKEEVTLEKAFQRAEDSTYTSVDSALKERVNEIVKEKQDTIIALQRKAVDKEGFMKLVYAALYKTVLTRPEINDNPSIDRHAAIDEALGEFIDFTEAKVSKLEEAMTACTSKYDSFDDQCDNFEDIIMDHLAFYEELQGQIGRTGEDITDLDTVKKGLQRKKSQDYRNPETNSALNQCYTDRKEAKNTLKKYEKLRRNTEKDMKKVKQDYAHSRNSKTIYEAITTMGEERLSAAEMGLNKLKQVRKTTKENETIRDLIGAITDTAKLGEVMADTYKPFFEELNGVFKIMNEMSTALENPESIINLRDMGLYVDKKKDESSNVYEELKSMMDFN